MDGCVAGFSDYDNDGDNTFTDVGGPVGIASEAVVCRCGGGLSLLVPFCGMMINYR